jgi:hypothetical protein
MIGMCRAGRLRRRSSLVLGFTLVALSASIIRAEDSPAPCDPVYAFPIVHTMWDQIANVGTVQLYINAPVTLVSQLSYSIGEFVGSSIEPVLAGDGSLWGAEGPFRGACGRVGIFRYMKLVNNSFMGTYWLMMPAPGGSSNCGTGTGDGENQELRGASSGDAAYGRFGMAFDCTSPGGGSGGSGSACYWDYGVIEASWDGGFSWEPIWEGWYRVCESGGGEIYWE